MQKVISIFISVHVLILNSIICAAGSSEIPILLLAEDAGFGNYTAEILKTEGFNSFQIISLSDPEISLKYLKKFDIVILTDNILTPAKQKMVGRFVKSGGNLIAFKPGKSLNEVFGIISVEGNLRNPYFAVNTNSEIGKGIIKESMQIHDTAEKYKLDGALQVAELLIDKTSGSGFPAVVHHKYGKGKAIAFLYNLPKSVALTRQGNPDFAGEEKDGINGLRPMDLFTDGWVDTSKNILNQADEQMRLLTRCIEYLNGFKKPLPRFWYFPDTLKCMVTLTNDGENSKEADFTPQFQDVDSKGAKMTLYVLEMDKISKSRVDEWIGKGHEISGHPDNVKQAGNPDWDTMDKAIKLKIEELKNKYGIEGMQTSTNHWFVWCGRNPDSSKNFAAQAKLEEINGIGLDCNYAHYDNNSKQGHFLGSMGYTQGNYTGSGMVMKFAGPDGKIINVYNQLNNVYDQQYMEHKDQDGFFNCFKGLMDRSLYNEVYSYICIRAHNNEYFFSKVPLMKILDYSNNNGIPVWTEVKLLNFLKIKDEARFKDILWKDNRLSFNIESSIMHTSGLTCIVPNFFNGRKINNITGNGEKQPFKVNMIKGSEYAWITIKPGFNYAIEISYK